MSIMSILSGAFSERRKDAKVQAPSLSVILPYDTYTLADADGKRISRPSYDQLIESISQKRSSWNYEMDDAERRDVIAQQLWNTTYAEATDLKRKEIDLLLGYDSTGSRFTVKTWLDSGTRLEADVIIRPDSESSLIDMRLYQQGEIEGEAQTLLVDRLPVWLKMVRNEDGATTQGTDIPFPEVSELLAKNRTHLSPQRQYLNRRHYDCTPLEDEVDAAQLPLGTEQQPRFRPFWGIEEALEEFIGYLLDAKTESTLLLIEDMADDLFGLDNLDIDEKHTIIPGDNLAFIEQVSQAIRKAKELYSDYCSLFISQTYRHSVHAFLQDTVAAQIRMRSSGFGQVSFDGFDKYLEAHIEPEFMLLNQDPVMQGVSILIDRLKLAQEEVVRRYKTLDAVLDDDDRSEVLRDICDGWIDEADGDRAKEVAFMRRVPALVFGAQQYRNSHLAIAKAMEILDHVIYVDKDATSVEIKDLVESYLDVELNDEEVHKLLPRQVRMFIDAHQQNVDAKVQDLVARYDLPGDHASGGLEDAVLFRTLSHLPWEELVAFRKEYEEFAIQRCKEIDSAYRLAARYTLMMVTAQDDPVAEEFLTGLTKDWIRDRSDREHVLQKAKNLVELVYQGKFRRDGYDPEEDGSITFMMDPDGSSGCSKNGSED